MASLVLRFSSMDCGNMCIINLSTSVQTTNYVGIKGGTVMVVLSLWERAHNSLDLQICRITDHPRPVLTKSSSILRASCVFDSSHTTL